MVASTGKAEAHDWLMELGASQVIGRLPAEGEKVRALGKSQWAAVVDSVGGDTLAYALSTLNYGGTAAISGLARSADLPTTVMPFILRGVTLAGIDSVLLSIDARRDMWRQLAGDLKPRHLSDITNDVSVLEAPDTLRTIIGGGVTGRTRVVVKDGF